MRKRIRSTLGFTLVELLVVVSIIALLISILLPSLRGARNQAKAVICMTNEQSLCRAFMYYAQDHGDRLPGTDTPTLGYFWWNAVDQYFDKPMPEFADCRKSNVPEVLFCPSGKAPFPSLYMKGVEITHYFLNGVETDKFMFVGKKMAIGLFGGQGKISQAKSPSKCMMLGDSTTYNKIIDMNHPLMIEIYDEEGGNQDFAMTRYHYRSTAGFFHNGRINIGYVDGHAAPLPGRKVPPDDDYAQDVSKWPAPMRDDPNLFYPNLSMPSAEEDPFFWGPPYDTYKPSDR